MPNDSKLRRVEVGLQDLLPSAAARQAYEDASAALEAGQMVRSLRKSVGLTQEALAEALSVSQARVSAIENGEGRDGPTYAVLKRIAAACNATGPIFAEPIVTGRKGTAPVGKPKVRKSAGMRQSAPAYLKSS